MRPLLITTDVLIEGKSFQHIAVDSGYWAVSLAQRQWEVLLAMYTDAHGHEEADNQRDRQKTKDRQANTQTRRQTWTMHHNYKNRYSLISHHHYSTPS